jgi:hypothetical protein
MYPFARLDEMHPTSGAVQWPRRPRPSQDEAGPRLTVRLLLTSRSRTPLEGDAFGRGSLLAAPHRMRSFDHGYYTIGSDTWQVCK